MGILVDSVNEVLNVQQEQIEPPPILGQGLEVEYMLGMAKIGARVVLLLDIDKVLSSFEYGEVNSEVQSQKTKAVG
jgi:purine-binding chemotaxis protein CheW